MTILLQYVAKISTMGEMRLLVIPKDKHKMIKKHVGEHVKITIESIWLKVSVELKITKLWQDVVVNGGMPFLGCEPSASPSGWFSVTSRRAGGFCCDVDIKRSPTLG